MAGPSKQEDRAQKTAPAAEARAVKRNAEKEARNERLRKQADDDLDAAYTKYGVSIPPQRLQPQILRRNPKPRKVMYVKNDSGAMFKTKFKKAYIRSRDNTCWVVGALPEKKGDVACEFKYSKGAKEYKL
jgi:hypothetical protein